MLGYTRAGDRGADLLPDHASRRRRDRRARRCGACARARPNSYHFEKRYLHKDGTPVWARLSGSVIRDSETGAPLHLVSQIEDIGARKQAEEAIAEAETRWSFALASAGQGLWDVDLKNGRHHLFVDLEADARLRRRRARRRSRPLADARPSGRSRACRGGRPCSTSPGKTPMFEAEFRMRHKQGHWIWILDRGKIVERDETWHSDAGDRHADRHHPSTRRRRSGCCSSPPCWPTRRSGCASPGIRSAMR